MVVQKRVNSIGTNGVKKKVKHVVEEGCQTFALASRNEALALQALQILFMKEVARKSSLITFQSRRSQVKGDVVKVAGASVVRQLETRGNNERAAG